MASLFRRHHAKPGTNVAVHAAAHEANETNLSDGTLKYTIEESGNGSGPSYQEASGAPVETNSPLGYAVGALTVLFLNFSKMVGTGVYSTRTWRGSQLE